MSDVRAHLELGERVLPTSPSRTKLLADCLALRVAAERQAGVAVVDWRLPGAEAQALVSPPKDVVALLPPLGGAVRVLLDCAPPAGGRGKLASWWFADALVVVASASEDLGDACAASAHGFGDDTSDDTSGVGVAAAGSVAVQHPPPMRAEVSSATEQVPGGSPFPSPWMQLLARVAGQIGRGAVFVLCEECDGADGRPTAAAAQEAVTAATGIPPGNILCVWNSLEAADAAPACAASPWRVAVAEWYTTWSAERAGKMRPAFAPMRETVQLWALLANATLDGGEGGSLSLDGGCQVSTPQPISRDGGGGGGSGGDGFGGIGLEGKEDGDAGSGHRGIGVSGSTAPAASEEDISRALKRLVASHAPHGVGVGVPASTSSPGNYHADATDAGGLPPSGAPADDGGGDGGERGSTRSASEKDVDGGDGAGTKLHTSAALLSLGSFLRTSIEGLPRLGVIGAPEIASRHMRQNPSLTRRGLLTTVYRYSAMEFAAGFVLSWMVPGPLAALAAHFTNRFRICFAANPKP